MVRVLVLILALGPLMGFVFALVLFVHLVRQRRSPVSTIAWLLAVFLVPYVGVPFYIVFGGRKMKYMTARKDALARPEQLALEAGRESEALQSTEAIFPRRNGNEVALLTAGEDAFRTVVELVKSAEESVHIATFILKDDDTGRAILDALTERARAGVKVRLLLDALGSRKIKKRLLAPLREAGGKCAFFMPMLHMPFQGRANLRNHRKIVLIDRRTAIIGGMNLAEEYMGSTTGRPRWHDLSLRVKGPVVSDIYTVFSSDWEFAAKEALPAAQEDPSAVMGDSVPLELVPSGPDVRGDYLFDTIVASLFSARRRIWIVTPYFIPDEMIVKALCIVARRGVDVRIVVPAVSNHRIADLVRRSYLRQVQEAGGKIHRFTPGMLHGKLIIVDERPAIVGSMNMDMRSLFLNYEIACFIYSERVVAELACWMSGIRQQCEEGVRDVPVPVEFLEGVGRLLAPLL
jgi:cardiolipin synthase